MKGDPHEAPLPEPVHRAADALLDRKAEQVVALDLRPISSATDVFLIGTGSSDVHVRAIAEHLVETLKQAGIRPDHTEGLRGGWWVLVDYIDFVVHVFHHSARDFYRLETLWGDAAVTTFEPE